VAAVFDALAAPRRREILRMVWNREMPAGEIHRALPDVTFGAVSQHLRVLEAAGLISRREEGRFRYYAARRRDLGLLGRWLETTWDQALSNLKAEAEAEERRERRGRIRRRRALGRNRKRSEERS
jgi:DNA-binding transcriptional ArsR family regulator